jgi:hypothetical protein
MIRPTAFGYNPETAEDNAFMNNPAANGLTLREIQSRVVAEHDQLRGKLEGAGIRVHCFSHEPAHGTPDATFPNNWFSTHPGTVVYYPMKAPSRRKERREDIKKKIECEVKGKVIDLSFLENDNQILEGTGSLVLDRARRIAYASLSARCTKAAVEKWCALMNYKPVLFSSADAQGGPIYHTNVVMAVGSRVAVVCPAAITSPEDRRAVLDSLRDSSKEIIEISLDQMLNGFCGNVLELRSADGHPVLAMSTTAFSHFSPQQLEIMKKHIPRIVHADIPTIENIGGGSVRCCIGEIFSGVH